MSVVADQSRPMKRGTISHTIRDDGGLTTHKRDMEAVGSGHVEQDLEHDLS